MSQALRAECLVMCSPDPGPVLANYGLDNLRFLKPVKPGDRIKVRITCKEKSLRPAKGYGEVRWDTEITNQKIVIADILQGTLAEAPVGVPAT